MSPYVIAITGASGAAYGIRLVKVLSGFGYPVELVVSKAARLVIQEETGFLPQNDSLADLAAFFGINLNQHSHLYSPDDLTAPIASGSYPTQGMAIVPCSMGSLGAIASGISGNLIHRAADCTLKEGRRLVLVPRETPLNAIHLENMLKLSRMGAAIVPAMPAFYTGMKNFDEMIDFIVGKVLDQMGVPHALYPRWTGNAGRKEWTGKNLC